MSVYNPAGVASFPYNPINSAESPVRYIDGVVRFDSWDLEADAFGELWGHNRSWSGGAGTSNDMNGSGWVIAQLPELRPQTTTGTGYFVVENAYVSRYYDGTDNTGFTSRFFDISDLSYDDSNDQYVLDDGAGSLLRFADFSTTRPIAQRGAFVSKTDPGGNVTFSSWKSNGRPRK